MSKRLPHRAIPKYPHETLDEYFERRDNTLEMRAEQLDRFVDGIRRDEPDEPIESLLDVCERKWAREIVR